MTFKINKTLSLLIVLLALIIVLSYWNKISKMFDTFIVTVDEVILGKQCPDYSVYDGNNYYLVFNNKEFTQGINPLVFANKEEMSYKLLELGCPVEPFIKNLIILRRQTNHDDPTENIERRCAKHIAKNKFGIDTCAFEFAHSGSDNLKKEINHVYDFITSENLAKLDNKSLNDLEPKLQNIEDQNMRSKALDNYKMIRKLVDFINQNDESVMVDYDLETCMFEEVGNLFSGQPSNDYPPFLNQQDLGTKKNIHKFRKHFGQQQELMFNDNNNTSLDISGNYLDKESHLGFVKYFNDANNVISDDVINTIFED
jgi:hypothetical protein